MACDAERIRLRRPPRRRQLAERDGRALTAARAPFLSSRSFPSRHYSALAPPLLATPFTALRPPADPPKMSSEAGPRLSRYDDVYHRRGRVTRPGPLSVCGATGPGGVGGSQRGRRWVGRAWTWR